jgi:hypothetical protein
VPFPLVTIWYHQIKGQNVYLEIMSINGDYAKNLQQLSRNQEKNNVKLYL